MAATLAPNLLYFGDNLTWLREQGRFPDESVDIVYLDPPFNSNRNYNVLFKESHVRESEAQIHAFEDTWSWDREGRVQEVFDGMPGSRTARFAEAARERKREGTQGRLG